MVRAGLGPGYVVFGFVHVDRHIGFQTLSTFLRGETVEYASQVLNADGILRCWTGETRDAAPNAVSR